MPRNASLPLDAPGIVSLGAGAAGRTARTVRHIKLSELLYRVLLGNFRNSVGRRGGSPAIMNQIDGHIAARSGQNTVPGGLCGREGSPVPVGVGWTRAGHLGDVGAVGRGSGGFLSRRDTSQVDPVFPWDACKGQWGCEGSAATKCARWNRPVVVDRHPNRPPPNGCAGRPTKRGEVGAFQSIGEEAPVDRP